MRRAFTLILLAMTVIVAGCAYSSAPPETAAPKAGSAPAPATAPAAKPSPSTADPAIKPPTKEHE